MDMSVVHVLPLGALTAQWRTNRWFSGHSLSNTTLLRRHSFYGDPHRPWNTFQKTKSITLKSALHTARIWPLMREILCLEGGLSPTGASVVGS